MQRKLALLLVPLLAATLWGCGSNRDSDSSSTPTVGVEDAASVGNCTICHTFDVHSEANVLAGLNPDAQGLGSAITHDCEACHGGGQYHHGEGPIPFPAPEVTRCAECHDDQVSKILVSKHNAEEGGESMIATGHDTGKCQRCHTFEGSREFAAVVGNKTAYDAIGTTLTALPNKDAAGNNILHNPTCGACHDAVTKQLVQIPGWDPNGNSKADQYDMCTSCHVHQLADGSLVGSGLPLVDGTATQAFYHDTAWYRNILTTHYDNPATLAGQGAGFDNPVEGYVIRKDSANPCFDCHGHELVTNSGNLTRSGEGYIQGEVESSIHTDWAKSAHAGGLLKAKYAAQENGERNADGTLKRNAVLTQIVTDAAVKDLPVGNAWVHYNWDDNASRGSCQHCHTATGAANFLSAAATGATYDATKNSFSHLSGWSATGGSPQNELLYCWGCHSSVETGSLRTTGAIKLDYKVNGADKTLTAADGNSAACLSCHSGRGNAEGITGSNTAANPTGAAVSNPGTKSHYLAAGLTINQAAVNAGYTFGLPAADYADPGYYAHNQLGCAECHMTSENSHSFSVVAKDETTGAITQIVSTKCVECHDGEHGYAFVAQDTTTKFGSFTAAGAAAALEEEAEGYHQALEALGAALTTAGTPPQADYPYFSGTPADQGHSGAMYNYSYLHHEPGAYAHNRVLAKRLIYDSLDWLDDKAMNESVTIDAGAYPHAAAWVGATRP